MGNTFYWQETFVLTEIVAIALFVKHDEMSSLKTNLKTELQLRSNGTGLISKKYCPITLTLTRNT
jgi:hypothetical protein